MNEVEDAGSHPYNYVIFGSMIQMLVGIRVIVQVTKIFYLKFGSNLYIYSLFFVKIYATVDNVYCKFMLL